MGATVIRAGAAGTAGKGYKHEDPRVHVSKYDDVLFDPDESTRMVDLTHDAQRRIVAILGWGDHTANAVRLNGRQERQMGELLELLQGHGKVSHVSQDSRTPAPRHPSDPQDGTEPLSAFQADIVRCPACAERGHGGRAAS
jgi:hypothetical protein